MPAKGASTAGGAARSWRRHRVIRPGAGAQRGRHRGHGPAPSTHGKANVGRRIAAAHGVPEPAKMCGSGMRAQFEHDMTAGRQPRCHVMRRKHDQRTYLLLRPRRQAYRDTTKFDHMMLDVGSRYAPGRRWARSARCVPSTFTREHRMVCNHTVKRAKPPLRPCVARDRPVGKGRDGETVVAIVEGPGSSSSEKIPRSKPRQEKTHHHRASSSHQRRAALGHDARFRDASWGQYFGGIVSHAMQAQEPTGSPRADGATRSLARAAGRWKMRPVGGSTRRLRCAEA